MSDHRFDIKDFTVARYRSIIELAAARYAFASFIDARGAGDLLYLRHDCDYSLERSRRIAEVEAGLGARSTFFINPHCTFYNLLERDQADIVRHIISLGHSIGLHFDAGFYRVREEAALDALVAEEAGWLRSWFSSEPTAVSFHNPDDFTLACEQDTYGGLVNCYSAHFKREVGYCSDSNGYWRHERIIDVMSRDPQGPLQVLTHPGWWQEAPVFPRARIMRCVQGRARSAIAAYDRALITDRRVNSAGPAGILEEIARLHPDEVAHLDILWSAGKLDLVYLGLLRLLATVTLGDAPADEIGSSLLGGKSFAPDHLEQACLRLSQAIVSSDLHRSDAKRDLT